MYIYIFIYIYIYMCVYIKSFSDVVLCFCVAKTIQTIPLTLDSGQHAANNEYYQW